jgi:cytochrome P450
MSLASLAGYGARGLTVARNTISVLRDPLQFLEATSQLGDAVRIEFGGGKRTLVLSHPAEISEVLVKHKRFPKRHLLLPEMKRFTGEGLATSDGELWRRQRKLIQPVFTRERVAGYADDLASCAARTVDRWAAGEVRDLYTDLIRMVLESTARTLFSAQVGDEATDVMDAVTVVMEHFANPLFIFVPWLQRLPLPRVRRLKDAKRRIDEVVHAVIAARQDGDGAAPAPRDLLTALLAARDEDGAAMSRQQLHDEVVTFYIAGYEPTAVGLAWTFHLLGEHPAVMARAREEARGVLGDRPATFADVARLPYIGHVIDEALRLYPPAWSMVREASEPCELAGQSIAPGGQMWMSPWVVHRDPRWYSAPRAFRPERWADGLERKLPSGAYMPYGSGPRICIGASLASAQLPMVVATVLSRVRLERVPGRAPKPFPSINLRPRGGVWARIGA